MTNQCLLCEKEFKERKGKKFCSHICGARYNAYLRYKRLGKLSYGKNHKEILKKSVKKNYDKNKMKWYSRKITKDFISGMGLLEKCAFCKEDKNLEIHHFIYPTKVKEIKKAIKEKKIILLCRGCHRKLHRKNPNANIYKE